VSDEERPGYYKDDLGQWQVDRRVNTDRRARRLAIPHKDRRNFYRRKTDRIILEREHHQMIEEAMEDFAAEHEARRRTDDEA